MSEELFSDDLGNLCAFILACGGQAYSWKRLKIAIYALSLAGQKEYKKPAPIFSYKFRSDCYAGPDDDDLRDDLDWLRDAGYLREQAKELYGASEHTLYELTGKGKELGLISLGYLTKSQKEALSDIADIFKDPSNSVIKLLEKLAEKWDNSQKEIIEKL